MRSKSQKIWLENWSSKMASILQQICPEIKSFQNQIPNPPPLHQQFHLFPSVLAVFSFPPSIPYLLFFINIQVYLKYIIGHIRIKQIDQFQQQIPKQEMEALLQKYHHVKKIRFAANDRFINSGLFESQEWRLPVQESIGNEVYEEIMRNQILESKRKEEGSMDEGDAHQYLYDGVNRWTPKKYTSETYAKSFKMPGLRDNFYLNLVDWSSNDVIAAGVNRKIFLISKGFLTAINIHENTYQETICSLAFNAEGRIGIGGSHGSFSLLENQKKVCIMRIQNHYGRVSCINWHHKRVATGSKDGTVAISDERIKKRVGIYSIHKQEVCGLKWNEDGSILATGSNDKTIGIFDIRKFKELIKLKFHNAAIKALDWCPQKSGLLASGGGTSDRKIKFFDIKTLTQKCSLQTETQICNLAFSKISKQLVTTHGFNQNQINVWSYDDCLCSLKKTRTLHGHKLRVLYLAVGPKGNSIVTGAADQTLKIWHVFENEQQISKLELSDDLR